jgi:hypothetical protein
LKSKETDCIDALYIKNCSSLGKRKNNLKKGKWLGLHSWDLRAGLDDGKIVALFLHLPYMRCVCL